MYNDTIKVANKIISDKDLEEIFYKMHEEMQMCEKQCKIETAQNEMFERAYQNWTVQDYSGIFKVEVNFYDDTNITFDNFMSFMSIFNSRIHEIKDFHVRYSSHYTRHLQGQSDNYIFQSIALDIYEDRMRIDVNLNSEDKIMDQVFDLIKEKILNAPEKYDYIIRKKSTITNKVAFAIGAIPAIFIATLLALVPIIRQAYAMTYVLFPVGCLLLAFLIGTAFCDGKIEKLYKNLVPEKKYAGFDSTNCKSIYKDDVEGYMQSSEIIIGKNMSNLKNRKAIKEMEEKYSKFIPKEIIAILVLAIIVVIVGKII